jgi:NAD(P)-dependent dehydrogenase (short-subunit alcohol dehydrogenase family)
VGGSAITIPGDTADAELIESAAERVEAELGPLDCWINNAMVTILAPVDQISPAEFRRVTEVDYLGTVYGTMAALSRMKPRNHGSIVQVGSALAYRGIPLQSAYCGAKHAIRGFTDSVRCELMHDDSGVHISMVQLPAVNTPQFGWCLARLPNQPQPVPPIYQPEVAARSIVWAADHRRREVIVGLSAVITIWGNKFLPALGDWYLSRTGYQGQQTDQPISPDRQNNLFEPVPGDQAAHGQFDDRARNHGYQSGFAGEGGKAILACTLLGVGLVGGAWLALRR